jgi:RNA polymerase sigma-70 factor (ECF subfamily)
MSQHPEPPGLSVIAAAAREGGSAAQSELLDRLRSGERAAFVELVDAWSPVLLGIARLHVATRASAEEVVQETWLAVIAQLDRFEGRSSLKTWVFRILENQARTRGTRETRIVPWSSVFPADHHEAEDSGPTVDPARFRGPDDRWPGHWTEAGVPVAWEPAPEDAVIAADVRRELRSAFDDLPERQRTVVELRDVHGLTSDEVCDRLGLTAGNQRILLHRGRARLRARLEDVYRSRERAGDHHG